MNYKNASNHENIRAIIDSRKELLDDIENAPESEKGSNSTDAFSD